MLDLVQLCVILIAVGIITGMVSLKFPLSSQPDLGDWKIRAVCKVFVCNYDFFSVFKIINIIIIIKFSVLLIIPST